MTFIPIDVFEQIINREIDSDIVYEDDEFIAFRDINPQAKIHILIVPKANIKTAKEVHLDNLTLFGKMFFMAKQIAEMEGLEGYKLHMNVDEAGGQIVPHVHLHLLSPDYKSKL